MSNTPFFDALLAEYDEKKRAEILKTMSTPFMSHPVAFPPKVPLPKRTAAQIIRDMMPTSDPEYARQVQEFIQTAPMKLLEGTPDGSFIKSIDAHVTDDGEYVMEAEVMVPPTIVPTKELVNAGQLPVKLGGGYDDLVDYARRDAAATMAMFQGTTPKLAWVDEWESSDPEEDEVYIAPSLTSEPIVLKEGTDILAEHKARTIPEDLAKRQLDTYRSISPFLRQKAAQPHDDRFTPPMSEKTMPSWIADEVRESNESLSDPEPEKNVVGISENILAQKLEGTERGLPGFFQDLVSEFREQYPDAENLNIHRKDEVDGSITISVTGTTPEQTDESVNAAPTHVANQTTVKPLWVTNEE
ncbi:hypothetical protein SEA_MADAMATO_79 [Streptomyces phage Madamato]|nr:hypothetical protein SEA_MADAMATO_79 [Streptomyces phage Madamato]